MPPIFEELANDIEGEIVTNIETLDAYSLDASPYRIYPQAVIYPKVTKDIEKIVSFAKTYNIPVTPRGLGKGSKGAALSPGIIIDMHRYFDKVGRLTLNDSRLVVQAGALYKDCVKRLAEWGYVLPFVDHNEEMTIGGMVATHYRSTTALTFGGIGDWVESIRIVLDDGKEYLVDSNTSPYGRLLEIYGGVFSCLQLESEVIFAAHTGVSHQGMGYDVFSAHISPKMLMQFILGSEGTLGIITEITLRLDTKRKHTQGIALSLTTLDDLPFMYDKILPTHPTTFDGFDNAALIASSKTNAVSKRHAGDILTLFLTYTGTEDSVKRSVDALFKICGHLNLDVHTIDEKELGLYEDVIFKRTANLKKFHSDTLTAISLCNDLVFPISSLHLAVKELQSLCTEHGVPCSTTISVGTGVARIETLFDLTLASAGDTITEMLVQTARIVKWYRGAITYGAGDGITNTPLLQLVYGAELARTLRKIKQVWDPSDIFNPGKKTTIDMTYLKKHFKRV